MFSELFKVHNLLSTLLGLAGLIFGIYSYWASQPKYEVSYSVRTRTVAELSSFGLSVLDQNSNEVIREDLCRTDIAFWVTGNTVIEDRVIRRPVAIVFPGGVQVIRKAVQAQINMGQLTFENVDKGLALKFKYLDPGAGAKLAFLTTCSSVPASMSGSTIGDLSITRKVEESSSSVVWTILSVALGLCLIMPVIRLSDYLDEIVERKLQIPWLSRTWRLTLLIILALLSWSFVIYVSYGIDQTFFATKMPAGISF